MSCKPGCSVCERLRALALEIVGEGCIEALSPTSLSQRAACSRAELSQHYETVGDCLYETYDELSFSMLLDVAGAFSDRSSWEAAYDLAQRRLLTRMAANPAEARLCFVEALRGDRRLRCRREVTQRWMVDLLVRERDRRCEPEGLSEFQIELLVGAGFHAISTAVAEGRARELPALEATLVEFAEVFKRRSSRETRATGIIGSWHT
jgi:hypothetical protein